MEKPSQSEAMHTYFTQLEEKLYLEIERANAARSNGEDPHPHVEIPLAKDLADRVENLIGVKGVAQRLREIESEGKNREESALQIGKEIAEGKVGIFKEKQGAVDAAIRVSMAVLTEGVVAAPIEGIAEVKIDKNSDGTEYLRIYYSGPVRSAGGTAQALSVLVGDYVRRSIGLDRFKPRKELIERYAEEIRIYKRTASLQYSPTDDEIRLIVESCPVCVDGDPTEDAEVEGYRNLPEIPTNRVRGGMALVIAEGMILKAPKVKKHVGALKMDGWEFLGKLIAGTKTEEKADEKTAESTAEPTAGMTAETTAGMTAEPTAPDNPAESTLSEKVKQKVKPKKKYMEDLIAGRPLFSHPSREGGFRLRYGRSRNTSLAAAGINPAAMYILDDFVANGTQLKVERPGKAAGMAAVDTIEGPTVRLKNGDVVRADDEKTAIKIKKEIEYIIDVGEILFNFGDFLENNHVLMPSPYCFEWWLYDYEKGYADLKEKNDPVINTHASRFPDPQEIEKLKHISEADALLFADSGIPLHPDYNYLWHDLMTADLEKMTSFVVENGKLAVSENVLCLEMPYEKTVSAGIKTIFENLLLLHKVSDANDSSEKKILISPPAHFLRCLGLLTPEESQSLADANIKTDWNELLQKTAWDKPLQKTESWKKLEENKIGCCLESVCLLSNMTVKARAPSRIGARMGRPEKSALRKMAPAAQALFPIGEHGGKTRNIVDATDYRENLNSTTGKLEIQIGLRFCPRCSRETHKWRCGCGEFTIEKLYCPRCSIETSAAKCPKCENSTVGGRKTKIEFRQIYKEAIERLRVRDNFEMIKGVKGMMSRSKTPEPLEKGILRSLHEVYIFKDGTVRYDMSDIPLTHIRADELGITAADLKNLGYQKDIYGKELTQDDQVVCLFVQDIVISLDCAEYLLKTTHYIDDLLTRYYGVDSYYECKDIKDLLGVMVIGLAPHTSAGVLGRVVGFTKASVGFAHPYFHASKRRNCDGDEDCIMLLLDGMLNFSREYLPDKRGGQMDAPLVLTIRIDPNEIDKEAHNIDMCARYPHEFYLASEEYKNPADLSEIMDLISSRLKTPDQYENFMFTHDTTDIAKGPDFSAYKTLETMTDKMEAQLNLACKIRAVDEADVAELVLKTHFLPDITGNLRAFSKQTVRCTKCETKYRRPPLTGSCPKCGGNVILTVHEGAVRKYVDVSKQIAEQYNVSTYTKERIELLEQDIIKTFENYRIKKKLLTDFM